MLCFWHKMNELSGNTISSSSIASLVNITAEHNKHIVQKEIEDFLVRHEARLSP